MLEKTEFCGHLSRFLKDLDKLSDACTGDNVDAIDRAYNRVDRAWTKLVNSAYNLEISEFNKSVNAYDKLFDKIDKVTSDGVLSDGDVDEISQKIDSTSSKLADIQTTICNG